jgi:uncharacterized circularly permuted ATP-grasp superfamily protein
MLPLLLAASLSSLAAEPAYYDEIRDENGKLRPGYAEILPFYEKLSEPDKRRFLEVTRADFQGDNALDPLPRLISESDYEVLRRGVEQRGRALQLFLRDYYSGRSDRIDRIMPREVLDRIVDRSMESGYRGLVNPDAIAFPYGPDIIRDARGTWRMVEDNPGFIGGPGDLIHARETLLKRMPGYQSALDAADDPAQFYRQLVARYREQARPRDGRIVLYMVPPYPDNEDKRIEKIFSALGVDIVTPHTKKKLIVTDRGSFLETVNENGSRRREPVGYLVLNGEHHFVDFTHAAAYERAMLSEAKDQLSEDSLNPRVRRLIEDALVAEPETGRVDFKRLRKAINQSHFVNEVDSTRRYQARGLTQAILSGRLPSNYSPGVDFIGDKEFYVYVEKIVREYLGEEPILKNIPTERFGIPDSGGRIVADEKLMDRVFSNPKKYVIKAVDGRGGDSVWVGPSIPEKDFLAVRAKILAEPERFIVQEYTHLSVLDGKIVDLRMISAVDSKGVLVSPTPWGRALPMGGDGKVNLSSNGREVAIVVVRTKPGGAPRAGTGQGGRCIEAFGALAPASVPR